MQGFHMRNFSMRNLQGKFLIFLATLLTISILLPSTAQANSLDFSDLTIQKTLPTTSGYVLKRFEEKLKEKLMISSKSKFNYRKLLLEKRLSEFISLVNNKDESQYMNASQRFSYQAGVLAQSKYKGSVQEKEEIITIFNKYRPMLEKIRDVFPANSAYWLGTQQNIDTLKILSSKLKND